MRIFHGVSFGLVTLALAERVDSDDQPGERDVGKMATIQGAIAKRAGAYISLTSRKWGTNARIDYVVSFNGPMLRFEAGSGPGQRYETYIDEAGLAQYLEPEDPKGFFLVLTQPCWFGTCCFKVQILLQGDGAPQTGVASDCSTANPHEQPEASQAVAASA